MGGASEVSEYDPSRVWPTWRLWLPLVCVIATVWGGSALAVVPPAAPDVQNFDKIAHFCVFGLMATLVFRALRFPFRSVRRLIAAYLFVIAFGILDEALQSGNPVRSFDAADWIADASGGLLALGLYRFWGLYRMCLEKRLWGRLAKSGAASSNAAP